jgi:hypothetical protein
MIPTRPNTNIGDTRGKIAILLEARRGLDVYTLAPDVSLDFGKDEVPL